MSNFFETFAAAQGNDLNAAEKNALLLQQLRMQVGAFPQEELLRQQDLQADIGSRRASRMEAIQRMRMAPAEQQARLAQLLSATNANDIAAQSSLLDIRTKRAAVAGEMDFDAAHGIPFGTLGQYGTLAQIQGSLAQAGAARVQTQEAGQSIASAKKWADLLDDPEKMQEFIDKQQAAKLGMKLDEYQAMQRGNTQAANAQDAQTFDRVKSFSSKFAAIEGQASKVAGYHVQLFGHDDPFKASQKVDEMLASNPDISEIDAFNGVMSTGAQLAQQKFMQITTPQGPSFRNAAPPSREQLWGAATPSPLQSWIERFLGGHALDMSAEEAQRAIASGMGQG